MPFGAKRAALLGALQFPGFAGLGGLSLWYEANDLTRLYQDSALTTPVTLDADPVGAWLPKRYTTAGGTNGSYMIQAVAGSRPTVVFNAYNGYRAIRFAGTDDVLAGSNFGVGLKQAVTYLVVATLSDSTAAGGLLDGGAGSLPFGHAAGSTTAQLNGQNTTGTFDAGLAVYSAIFNGGQSVFRKNGVAYPAVNGGVAELNGFRIGSNTAGTAFWVGDVAEVVVMDTISLEMLALATKYLGAKYGVAVV